MLYLLTILAQEVLDIQDKDTAAKEKWASQNKEKVLSLLKELHTRYHTFPGIAIDILRELKSMGYDLCYLWRILKTYYPQLNSYQSTISEIEERLLSSIKIKKMTGLVKDLVPSDVIQNVFFKFEKHALQANGSQSQLSR